MQRKCTARRKHTKEPCGNFAVKGSLVCRMHGGSAAQVRASAAGRLAEESARKAFGKLADHSTPVTDPLTALGELAGHAAAWMRFLAGRIETLESLRFEDAKGAEQIRGEIQLWERALDRCNTVFGTAARLNIDERLSVIEEKKAEIVIKAIEAAFDAAEVPRDRREAARIAAAKHLRLASIG